MTKTHKKAAKGSKLASLAKSLLGRGAAGAKKKAPAASAPAAPVPAVKAVVAAKGKGAPAPAAKADGKKAGAKIAPPATAKNAKAASAALAKVSKGRGRTLSDDQMCREVACEGLSTSGGYCRMHYIKNWKKIKRKELILKEKKLNQYIEELVAKYPDKYIEAIRQDLSNDKDFAKVIHDLDLDESVDDFEGDNENAENLLEGIRRDFEDEGEGGF